jgi:hypothetical protein
MTNPSLLVIPCEGHPSLDLLIDPVIRGLLGRGDNEAASWMSYGENPARHADAMARQEGRVLMKEKSWRDHMMRNAVMRM